MVELTLAVDRLAAINHLQINQHLAVVNKAAAVQAADLALEVANELKAEIETKTETKIDNQQFNIAGIVTYSPY